MPCKHAFPQLRIGVSEECFHCLQGELSGFACSHLRWSTHVYCLKQRVSCGTDETEEEQEEEDEATKLLIIECDGVLVDIHKNGHLPAFNLAFHELGLDCANWTPVVSRRFVSSLAFHFIVLSCIAPLHHTTLRRRPHLLCSDSLEPA